MYSLYIANKNYSSWSLRPWVLLRELGIPFTEHGLSFGDADAWRAYRKISPSGKVPCLVDGATAVWDSLAIAEYVAEGYPVWPAGRTARAWARCAAAEMHSGFQELRNRCSMTCAVRLRLHAVTPALEQDLARLGQLWQEGLTRFGGPFLAGPAFSAADAFFAPVAFRLQSYGLNVGGVASEYAARLRDLSSMREWYAAALVETTRDAPHDTEIARVAQVLEDLRAAAGQAAQAL